MMLKVLKRVFNVLYPDRRPQREQKSEREFINAANSFKTLRVSDRGGMSIDPKELRDQIVSSREQLKHLVHKPQAAIGSSDPVAGQGTSAVLDFSKEALDCIEIVIWRLLTTGATVRYTCLQCMSKGRFIVTAASLFSGDTESVPTWVDGNTSREIASALKNIELDWYATVGEALDCWR